MWRLDEMWRLAPISGSSLRYVEARSNMWKKLWTFGGLALKLWTIEKRVEQAGWKGGDKEKRHKIK
jgi:hypothetical protein